MKEVGQWLCNLRQKSTATSSSSSPNWAHPNMMPRSWGRSGQLLLGNGENTRLLQTLGSVSSAMATFLTAQGLGAESQGFTSRTEGDVPRAHAHTAHTPRCGLCHCEVVPAEGGVCPGLGRSLAGSPSWERVQWELRDHLDAHIKYLLRTKENKSDIKTNSSKVHRASWMSESRGDKNDRHVY